MKMKQREVRRGRAYWVELVNRWQGSGESQRAVSEAAGVNVHTLQYWVAKLKAEAGDTGARHKASPFVEVRGVSVSTPAVACRLRLGDTMVLEMSSMPPASWVRELGERAHNC